MGLFEKLGSLFGAEEEEYDDYEEDVYSDAGRKPYPSPVRKTYGVPDDVETLPRREPLREPLARERERERENVIQLHTNETIQKLTSQFKIVVIEPKGFDECPRLVDDLKGRRPVIINLGLIDEIIARKVFDFLSGATYALNGNVQKIAQSIFVFLPENVDVENGSYSKGFKYGDDPGNYRR